MTSTILIWSFKVETMACTNQYKQIISEILNSVRILSERLGYAVMKVLKLNYWGHPVEIGYPEDSTLVFLDTSKISISSHSRKYFNNLDFWFERPSQTHQLSLSSCRLLVALKLQRLLVEGKYIKFWDCSFGQIPGNFVTFPFTGNEEWAILGFCLIDSNTVMFVRLCCSGKFVSVQALDIFKHVLQSVRRVNKLKDYCDHTTNGGHHHVTDVQRDHMNGGQHNHKTDGQHDHQTNDQHDHTTNGQSDHTTNCQRDHVTNGHCEHMNNGQCDHTEKDEQHLVNDQSYEKLINLKKIMNDSFVNDEERWYNNITWKFGFKYLTKFWFVQHFGADVVRLWPISHPALNSMSGQPRGVMDNITICNNMIGCFCTIINEFVVPTTHIQKEVLGLDGDLMIEDFVSSIDHQSLHVRAKTKNNHVILAYFFQTPKYGIVLRWHVHDSDFDHLFPLVEEMVKTFVFFFLI
eukprot:TRINITY_DN6820_c0_g1_i7.p1 TRINITY_DN6820_c0_g1~~TRINITY_DN6820_c0_g1_i7.p1  ORF type:complete len:463 (+),score=67.89 TRINITY_DN6820_c0_g1_i7:573-1961(+)